MRGIVVASKPNLWTIYGVALDYALRCKNDLEIEMHVIDSLGISFEEFKVIYTTIVVDNSAWGGAEPVSRIVKTIADMAKKLSVDHYAFYELMRGVRGHYLNQVKNEQSR